MGHWELRGVSESSQNGSKKKCWLNVLHFDCHLFPNGLLGNVYSDPTVSTRFKITVEVVFLNAVEYRLHDA
jgi:hypothetical protein